MGWLRIGSLSGPRIYSAVACGSRLKLHSRTLCLTTSTAAEAQKGSKGRTYATPADSSNLYVSPDPADSFLHGEAASYIDNMYYAWRQDPQAVHLSWQTYFRNMEDCSLPASREFQPPPGLISGRSKDLTPGLDSNQSNELVDYLKVQHLVRAFQEYGHTAARTNPLERVGEAILQPEANLPTPANIESYGFTTADLDHKVRLGPTLLPGLARTNDSTMTLRDVIATCERIYCSTFSAEFHHISSLAQREWIRAQLEIPDILFIPQEEKKEILKSLVLSTTLEQFLATKFPNEKRFGLDGVEAMTPGLAALIDRCVDLHGVKKIITSTCHRGRMNIMSTVYGRSYEDLFRHFAGLAEPDITNGHSGDVKYHYGAETTRTSVAGNKVEISILHNPSHLETTVPVAQGQTKAAQRDLGDAEKSSVMCLTSHTDAAYSGQGSVYETLNLSKLMGYEVGGTVRIIVNNQIGFTTDPASARSTRYCTDVAKYIEAPMFHVNADDPEAVVFVFRLAADWKAQFQSDCIVDLVCYRRFGHNEIDQASFTQPEMYKMISQHKSVMDKYGEKLIEEGLITADDIAAQKQQAWSLLEKKLSQSKVSDQIARDAFIVPVTAPKDDVHISSTVSTGVEKSILEGVMKELTTVPKGFAIHRNLRRIMDGQKNDFAVDSINWSTAESLAFGSLLVEGNPVRITGEDVERGTFSQRHSVLHDQNTYGKWVPLNNIATNQASYTAYNSPLSEFSVLGFEYGYSLAAPSSLIMWEAQFGDFANNAQVIIDQFVSSGEAKWLLQSGLVLSLPHGYDGQGPEHSSARLGRFLELCNEDPRSWPDDLARQRKECNIQVVCMTSPANLFHVLRRQIHSPSKKPLVILFSKSLLRHPLARSSVSELTPPNTFRSVLEDPEHGRTLAARGDIQKIIICSGQVFAALHKHRAAHNIIGVAIVRIEELHPFPWAEVRDHLDAYTNAMDIVWCQEEPYNGGAWQYVRDRLETVLEKSRCHVGKKVRYAGRKPGAGVATGSKKVHQKEETEFLDDSFDKH